MENYVRSFVEKGKQHFASRPVGRRAKSAFPSLFQRLWRPIQWLWGTIPSYLPFYILVSVLAYALWYGLQKATVIVPFHVPPENKDKPLPFGGGTVADVLQDALTSIRAEAEGSPGHPPCEFESQTVVRDSPTQGNGPLERLPGLPEPLIGSLQMSFSSERPVVAESSHPFTTEVKGISPRGGCFHRTRRLGNGNLYHRRHRVERPKFVPTHGTSQ